MLAENVMLVLAVVIIVAFFSFFVFDAAMFVIPTVAFRPLATDEKEVRSDVIIVGVIVTSVLRSRSDPDVLVDCRKKCFVSSCSRIEEFSAE